MLITVLNIINFCYDPIHFMYLKTLSAEEIQGLHQTAKRVHVTKKF